MKYMQNVLNYLEEDTFESAISELINSVIDAAKEVAKEINIDPKAIDWDFEFFDENFFFLNKEFCTEEQAIEFEKLINQKQVVKDLLDDRGFCLDEFSIEDEENKFFGFAVSFGE